MDEESSVEDLYLDIDNAIENLDADKLEHLLSVNPSIDVNVQRFAGWTLLNGAIDAEVDVHENMGWTGLPQPVVSLLLIAYGADPTQKHRDGWDSIDLARKLKHILFLRALGLPMLRPES